MNNNFSNVEKSFYKEAKFENNYVNIPYIAVESFPKLGLMSALSFIEWVAENPKGVVSLPTGKTAMYFINFLHLIIDNWDTYKGKSLRERYNLDLEEKPDFSEIQYVQMGEFYPIDSSQHNSLYNFAKKHYIDGLGFNEEKSLLINSDDIKLADGLHFSEVFPNYELDLSLRLRKPINDVEKLKKRSIFIIDNWCKNYEKKIREKGGIGFFLSPIGPDGHIAFNVQGTNHYSATRLAETNFETQAVTAADLGGIEVSKKRLVITIGLGTISYNKDIKAIVYAAGEAIAPTIKSSIEEEASVCWPASSLQKLPNSRFYLTDGATVKLQDAVDAFYEQGEWTHKKTERAVIELCNKINKFGINLTLEDLKADKYCSMIPNLNENTVQSVIDSIKDKLDKGTKRYKNEVFYHTGPHHDDIMLGIMPATNRQSRDASNEMHFSVATSGYTSVTNKFLSDLLLDIKHLMSIGKIEMLNYPDFFQEGYKHKRDKDVYHYLNNIASRNDAGKRRGLCHRAVRNMVGIWNIKDEEELVKVIDEVLEHLAETYAGGKNTKNVQVLKGSIREFEEELVWAHYGIKVSNVHHLHLGFYGGDIFDNKPKMERDVLPILNEFRKYKPTIISLAMDPQGSGPDTHYKVLQAIARAVEEWNKEEDLSNLKIHGYRNVWFKYNPWDIEMLIPVSLNSLATLNDSFTECYMTQVDASFPSYQLDGKFSELTRQTWVEQHKQIQLLLGKDFFYQNESALLRATHGMVYLHELNVEDFLNEAFSLEKAMDKIL